MASSSSLAEITTSSDSFLINTHDDEDDDDVDVDQQEAALRFLNIPKIKVSDPSIETINVNSGGCRPSSPRTSPNFHFGAGGGGQSSSPFPSSRFSSSHHTPSSSPSSYFSSYFKYPSWNVFENFNVGIFSRFHSKKQYQQQFLSKQYRGKRRAVPNTATGRVVWYRRKRVRGVLAVFFLVGLFFFMNWWMLSRLQDVGVSSMDGLLNGKLSSVRGEWSKFAKGKRSQRIIFSRMLALAAHALAEGEGKPEPKDLWEEPLISASAWTPCADQRNWEPNEGNNGYILVSANGGINQQRVAVCNIVALARLLNSTLVVPKFLFSSVWRDAR
ncbi:hypothetical protein AQUCO_03200039v1 [Aquilegia coerulea]|uniref:O-fucosyltransferase family protein n=1 Tax=Aquilegia coerulea TaxID=218851 RepID=A0A2G5CZV3_AQUCA|nr:hypothetical protein AQUCO_03200039v1 [Aquilegia coerulea]